MRNFGAFEWRRAGAVYAAGAQDDERIGGKFPDATLSRLIQTTNTPTHQPKEKGQPRLRLAFLTDAYLLAEQRFDIQPLRL